MTKIRIKLIQKNKYIIIIFFIIITIIIFCNLFATGNQKSLIQKLRGAWNVEADNSVVLYREWNCLGTIMFINNNKTIELPVISKNIPFEEMYAEATGTWTIISTNPDSVYFNVPLNPLHGKYAVEFFIDYDGYVLANMKNNIFKMALSNDSTLLICNKGGNMFGIDARKWETKN